MSSVTRSRRAWDRLGRQNPMWAVLVYRDDWDEDAFFSTGRAEIAEVLSYAETLGDDLPRGRALDFGCGIGRLTRALTEHFDHATGVDVAPSMIEEALRLNAGISNCAFVLNVKPHLRVFDEKTFDFIYSNIVLQHVEPALTRRYLNDFVRLLSPQGLLLFQLPSHLCAVPRGPAGRAVAWLRRRARPLRRVVRPQMEMHGLPRQEVERVIAAAGGHVAEVQSDDSAGPKWVSYRYAVRRAG